MMLRIIVMLFAAVNLSFGYAQDIKKVFDFSAKKDCKDCISVNSPIAYGEEQKEYGFDLNTAHHVSFVGRHAQRTLYSHKPFYFSVAVPEGNYKVTIHYEGMPSKAFESTVRAESRRLQLEKVRIGKKKNLSKSFNVHIKSAFIDDTKSVKLKLPREVQKLDWDNKLTLEFQGENNIRSIEIERVPNLTTVYLAGNSTVVNQEEEPWASWGQMIPRFFDQKVAVSNHAESGLSLGSFLSSNRLDKILSIAQPGDYLFIEFGHNDQKEKGEQAGAFKSYAERLRLFVTKFREKGGYPVIVTSTARRAFDKEGKLQYTLGDFPQAARTVAAELDVPLIDLNKMTRSFYETLGVEGSKNALVHYPAHTFPNQTESLQDNTHFNTYGAYQISKMILQGIKELKLPLADHIVDFKKYNPKKPDRFPDWEWPQSLINSAVKPDGN